MKDPTILIQQQDFDAGREYQALREAADRAGAIVTFTGLVRELYAPESSDPELVTELFIEHYPGMTERRLQAIAEDAMGRWPLPAVRILHRVGRLRPGEQIVFVGTASAHRRAALDSATYIMDYLKSHAPFWKQQQSTDGSRRWIQARPSDADALDTWNIRHGL